METASKKKRGTWSEENLQNAINAFRKNEMSQREAAKVYQIPRRTLRNHLATGSLIKRMGRKTILSESQERDLATRIKRFSEIGIPLTPKIIRKQAYVFCALNNIKKDFNAKEEIAGKVWLRKFMKRNPDITKRKAQYMNPGRAQKLNKTIVSQHFEAIKTLYDKYDITSHPERLYNIDKKGCRLTLHHQQQVLAERGAKRLHMVAQEHAENVTIAMCINATGNAIPPMIIFKGQRMKEEYKDNLPPGTLVKMAPKGCMTTRLFVDFIEHLANYKSLGTCLLIFDGASSHLDYQIVDAAEKNNIILYCLPSNTTHELQPLGKLVNNTFC